MLERALIYGTFYFIGLVPYVLGLTLASDGHYIWGALSTSIYGFICMVEGLYLEGLNPSHWSEKKEES